MSSNNYLHSDVIGMIIKAYYKVFTKLGYGFLEKVYENAMLIELQKLELSCVRQSPIEVFYDQTCIGNYFADIIVEGKVIIELKACDCIITEHEIQLVNYLKATDIQVGMLLNFGKEPEYIRKVFENSRKRRGGQQRGPAHK